MKDNVSKFKKIRLPFIMCIINFLIGLVFAYTTIGIPLKYVLIILLISFLPFLIFLILTMLCYWFSNKKKILLVLKIITVILSCLQILYYCVALFIILILEGINPVTNIKYYNYYIDSHLNKVFPDEIPDNVENIEFYYAPGFLQGGTNYALYYIDKNMSLDKFNELYEEKAIWIGYRKDYKANKGLLNGIFHYTPVDSKNGSDFIIYLVEGECDDSGYCNHGNYLLTAYNEKTNEVIFRSEIW